MEYLGSHNKPKADVHPGQKLTGPKEEEEELLARDHYMAGEVMEDWVHINWKTVCSSFKKVFKRGRSAQNCSTHSHRRAIGA
jgi:hypothetical protein